ncbi:MAG: Hint domain-containing protein [Pseudomonadota bacterium]
MFEGFSFFSKPFEVFSSDTGAGEDAPAGGTQQSGLAATTTVATSRGWMAVGDLKPGDLVLTFDAGLQTVTQISRETPWMQAADCPQALWPLEVPAGAFGNAAPFHLLSGQNIMVESDAAEDMFGDPFSLIPASALLGLRGIEQVPPKDAMDIVHVYFAEEQVVFGEHGALYLCPSSRDMVDVALHGGHDPLYSILPLAEARIVASSLGDDMASISGETPQEILDAAYA